MQVGADSVHNSKVINFVRNHSFKETVTSDTFHTNGKKEEPIQSLLAWCYALHNTLHS